MPALGRMLDRCPTERMFAAGRLVIAATVVSAALVRDLWSALGYAAISASATP
ncbi:MAG TPA: hypothetical protein VFG47_20575 [Geminicoccaceae bacterium]|nr:hypothetical protein [Geminicoccaceae bacterium]